MKKNKSIKYIILITLFLIELISIFLTVKSFSNKEVTEIKQVNKIDKHKFAMYIQRANGEYLESTNYLWPTGNYLLNIEKSSCVDSNGEEVEGVLSYSDGTVYLNSKKTVFCYVYFDSGSICTIASDSTVAEGLEGAKYNCKVDPNKDAYIFYLLDNNEDGTSDLIMNANINASGEAVIPGVTTDVGEVAWYEDEINNIHGPVTAMTYLHNATKSWTNVDPLNYTYNDREFQGVDINNPVDEYLNVTGYQSFVSTNGIAVITKGDTTGTQVTIGTSTEPLRARLPIYRRDNNGIEYGDVANQNSTNAFLYGNLDYDSKYEGPFGYWTLSAVDTYYGHASVVMIDVIMVEMVNWSYGVRPVITVELN